MFNFDECEYSIEPKLNFKTYNREIHKIINGGKHLLDKEPVGEALLVPNRPSLASMAYLSSIERIPSAPGSITYFIPHSPFDQVSR